MRAAALVAGLFLVTTAALAKPGTPGPHYFEGSYDRVGRTGGAAPVMVNDHVRIAPVGQSVAITGCTGPDALMGFGPAFELVNLMTGVQGGVAVECLFHNNGYNRPILTCTAEDGAAFTLWPQPHTPLDCG